MFKSPDSIKTRSFAVLFLTFKADLINVKYNDSSSSGRQSPKASQLCNNVDVTHDSRTFSLTAVGASLLFQMKLKYFVIAGVTVFHVEM